MARKLITVEISLVNCTLNKSLSGRKKASSHLLHSSLLWPRAGISSRSSAASLALLSGSCDFRDASWSKRIVFKENVESTFGLKVDISEPLGDESIDEFMRFMAGTLLALGSDVIEDAVPVGKVIAAPVDFLAKKVKKMPNADLVASGSVDVCVDDVPAKGELLLPISLSAPVDVIKRSRRTVNRKTKVTKKTLIKKGEPNGELTLSIKRI